MVSSYIVLVQFWLVSGFWMVHLRRFNDGELFQEATVRRQVPPNITWSQLLQAERSQTVELMEEVYINPLQ